MLLYQVLLDKNAPEDKESLFARVCPGKSWSPTAFRLLMSDLQKLLDQFLALEHWLDTPAAVETNMTQAYRQRGLERHFEDALNLAKTGLERNALRNSDYFIRSGQLLWEEARFQTQHHLVEERYLLALSENADMTWLTQKLRYLCLHTAYRTRFKSAQELPFRAEVELMLELPEYFRHPAVSTWYYCLKMLESQESEPFFQLFKTEVFAHGLIFRAEEMRDLHLFAINYCIRQVNKGHVQFFHDIMDFYKDGLSKGHLLDKGELSHFTYYNIVAAALQTRDYAWAENFVQDYQNLLERRYRDSAYSFNLARLKFARKAYSEALELLQHSNYHEPLLNMAAKTMAIKIYYELDEYEVLDAHLEAFIKYIRRKPGLGYHRQHYLQMARYTQKLIHLNWMNKTEVQALRERIAAESALAEKEWLLERF
ncbi:MAG: hypothetical protein JNN28_15175 [Saprospiraceae bacterium]|nr:hypothetical protein [Saprospiraceae bacterium]